MLESGTLWTKITEQTQKALDCGALQPIETTCEVIEEGGIPFLVRILANLRRKDKAREEEKQKKSQTGQDFNPFLTPDPNLFVADFSATHLGLLNKFNVVDHHLLIVTREFEEQDSLLTLADFEAMWIALGEIDGLAFYNGGRDAGASQRHKHLQLVPFPLIPGGLNVPIEPAIASAIFFDEIGTIPQFDFEHGLIRFPTDTITDPKEAAKATLDWYLKLLEVLNIGLESPGNPARPYNFLATRNWMLIVSRSREKFEQISVNSLGFAGALLVRNSEQIERLKQHRPLNLLKSVACPRKLSPSSDRNRLFDAFDK
ncbi:MAG: ATP adenylyltransferase family protein [Limnospira sp.]